MEDRLHSLALDESSGPAMRPRKLFSFLVSPLITAWPAVAQEVGANPRLAPPAMQDFDRTVLAIRDLKFNPSGVAAAFGTGFCVDPICEYVATNYHIEEKARPLRIGNRKIVARHSATGPNDEGAIPVRVTSGPPLKFNYSRDLALFKLDRPLTSHHGIGFSFDQLQIGQKVDICVYPLESTLKTRKLILFHGRFTGVTEQQLLAFDYEPSEGHRIRPGSSGGIIVDQKSQKIVGVVCAIAEDGTPAVFAVSAQSLAEFVARVEPDLAQSLFTTSIPAISPASVDLYPKLEPPHTGRLQHHPDESPDIRRLRNRAQLLADSTQNFIARQYVEWGADDKVAAASALYEIRVLDGNLRFREFPDGKKELQNLPFPPLNTAIVTGDEWSELPRLVAWEPRLRIEQMPDNVINGQRLKVFRYRGDVEDAVCRWRSSIDFGFFAWNKDATVSCYGEVWTDEDTNILRMSEHYELPGSWKNYAAVMTYGWLQRPDEAPRLIPTAITAIAGYHGKAYWCRSQFLHYQVFTSGVKMTMK